MNVTLYWFELSNPGQAVRLMLERKGIAYRTKDLLPGLHPLQVRLAGFPGATVPALKIDGRRVQGSLRISRALEALRPEPPLLPSRDVEEAEAWGESVLQPVTGRIFHWAVARDVELREWLFDQAGLPAARAIARVTGPVARRFDKGATDAAVERDLRELPGMLDHVDGLIAKGTIGTDEPNAADYQIATTVREVMSYSGLRSLVEGRPAQTLAMRILPRWEETPVRLPAPAGPPGARRAGAG